MRGLVIDIPWPKWEELKGLGHPVHKINAEFNHPTLGRVRVYRPPRLIRGPQDLPDELFLELIDEQKLRRYEEIKAMPVREAVDALNAEFCH